MAVGCALKMYCIVNIHKMSEKHLRKLSLRKLSFDKDIIIEKTLRQTLAYQLSSSFHQDMIVEKTLMQTHASRLPSTLILV